MSECVWVIFLLVLSLVLEFKEFNGRKREDSERTFLHSVFSIDLLSTP
jgi:hypothetical protein